MRMEVHILQNLRMVHRELDFYYTNNTTIRELCTEIYCHIWWYMCHVFREVFSDLKGTGHGNRGRRVCVCVCVCERKLQAIREPSYCQG